MTINTVIEELELFAKPKKDLSAEVNAFIDEALLADSETKRDYLGASLLGDNCPRRIQYTLDGVAYTVTGTQKRIFAMGHALEKVIAKWLQKAGFKLETADKYGKPYGFEQAQGFHLNKVQMEGADGRIRGHVDGIIRKGPLKSKYPLLWECKTMKASQWKELVKQGVEISHPHYYVQVQLYMAYLNLRACLLTSLNKDSAELHHEIVPFNAQVASNYSDRAVEILRATEAKELKPRIAASRDYFECKMCRFYKTCWEG